MSTPDEDSEEWDDPPEPQNPDDGPTPEQWRQFGAGIVLGVGAGALVGVWTDNLVFWLSVGFALGFALGAVER